MFDDSKLREASVIRNFRITAADGKSYDTRDCGPVAIIVMDYASKVTAELAKVHAESEFEKYGIVQDRLFESDFDRLLKQLEMTGKPPKNGQ